MNPAASCPPRPRFEALVQGSLPFDDVEPLAAHLERCDGCAQTVAALTDTDTLAGELRAQAAAPCTPPDGALQLVMTKLRTLRGVPASGPATMELESHDFLAPPQRPGELGRLAHYRVVRVLGIGGMGVVFLAEDTALCRLVALKVMKPALAASATAKQRFVREAHAIAALKHERIVAIYQVGEDRGLPFLAMEFLEGRSLEDALREGTPMTLAQVLRIGREIAEGLAAAHQRGLIHRDIKPANLWLTAPDDSVKILDFGLARGLDDDARITQQGAIVGTPAYMAPEQAEAGATDHRADLFSLGCVLYHLLTGQAPFRGDTTLAALTALATETPRPVRALNPSVPEPVADLVRQLLARTAAERPPSAAAVVQSIQALERGPELQPRRRPSRRAAIALLGLLALAGMVLAAWQIVIRVKTRAGQVEVTVSGGAAPWTNIVRSEAVGGKGGQPFEQIGDRDTFLTGFAYRTRFQGDRTEIAYLQPIYQTRAGRKTAGPGLGYQPDSQPHADVEAKAGYAVGAVEVWSSDCQGFHMVRGFRVQFLRRKAETLDAEDAYWSDWLGLNGAGKAQLLGGGGRPVVGIFGRAGGGIDALGIIQAR